MLMPLRRVRFTTGSWFVVLIYLAFAVKLMLAITTIGTNDAVTWLVFLKREQSLGGIGLYHHVDLFNHPPFMIHVLRIMGLLATSSGLPFYFWLRLPAIVADVVSAVLLWHLLSMHHSTSFSPRSLLLLAFAPTSIMISGFHDNTDPVMICFVLLTVALLDHDKSVWLASIAFGMSMNIKVLPIIFLPTLLLGLPHNRKRVAFCAAAGATFVVCGLPFILQDPLFILVRLFGYGSNYGDWGLSRVLGLSVGNNTLAVLSSGFQSIGKYMMLAAILAEAVWMSRLRHKPTLFLQCGVVALTFMTLTPGFGAQYLAWLVPWVVTEFWMALLYYTTSGIFLFMIYTSWAGTFPWFLAVSFGSRGPVVYAEILCWLSVVVLLIYRVWSLQRESHFLVSRLYHRLSSA